MSRTGAVVVKERPNLHLKLTALFLKEALCCLVFEMSAAA